MKNNSFFHFLWCDECKFRNAVIRGSDTDLSDAHKCFILCFSMLFPAIGWVLPTTDKFFDEKLVCADLDNILVVMDTYKKIYDCKYDQMIYTYR